jgi:hypothetical protein
MAITYQEKCLRLKEKLKDPVFYAAYRKSVLRDKDNMLETQSFVNGVISLRLIGDLGRQEGSLHALEAS